MGKSYTKVKDFVVAIESGIKRAVESQDCVERVAHEVAEPILQDVTNGRKLRYNDWSGNLRRSYVVRITSKKQYFLFKSGLGVSAKPIVMVRKQKGSEFRKAYYFRLRRKGHAVKSMGKNKGGYVYHMRKTVLSRFAPSDGKTDERGKVVRNFSTPEFSYGKRKEGLVRQMRPIEKEIESNPRERHQYVSGVPQGRARTTMSVLIGNYTPYRRSVEKSGYKVIDPKARSRYKNLIKEKAAYVFGNEINKVCASINRGQLRDVKTGRFIKG